MKEIYVDGYDTVVEFPDETPDAEIQKALASNFPETDDQFVNRIADPATPASAVSFEDFQRYQELKPELSWGDLGNLVVQGAGVAAGELYNGVKSTLSLAAQGQLGTLGASVAEGAARGTYDLASLGKRIQDNVTTMLEPYMQESGDAQKDQYNRFLAIKEMDNVREAARKGDATILQRFGIGVDPSMVDTESAEGFSYFLDPTVLGTGGSGKLASMLTKAGAKPAELAGRAAGGLARGISRAESKAAELIKSGTAKVDEMTGGLGKYAIPGSVGAAAYGAGLGVTGGAAVGAIFTVPALELAEGLFKGFANSMLNNPTRIGPMRHLAMTAPATLAGRAAGNLKWMDPALDLAAKGTTGAVIGSAYGAGLGGLAGGWAGAAQGLGAGSVLGAGTAGTMRLAEGVTGRAKVRAEENDYTTWRMNQNKDFQEFLDRSDLTWADRIHVMDGAQLMDGGLGEDGAIRVVQDDVIRKMIADQGGEGTARGFQTIEGERPVYYVNLGYDGYGKPISTVDTLFHEMFHGLARLDGFDGLVAGISNEIGKMYSPDEVNALIREYESQGKTLKESEGLVTTGDKFAALAEEIGAEYFANYIKGKDSSYLLKGTPFKDALNSITSKFVAGKLDRVYNTFQSEIFKHTHLKQSKGMDRAMNDLIKARRKAYRDVELSADDAIRAYGERDLGNDQIFKELQALGVAGLDNKGRRVMKTAYAIKKDDSALGKEVSDALSQADPTGGMLKNPDGSWVGRNFSPAQIEALLNAPGLSDKVKEVIQFIDTIRKAGSDAANVTYAAATYKTKRGKTRYRNLPISNRDALIYGIEVSPVGTMIARILDLSLLRSKIVWNWTGDSRLQRVFGSQEGMYEDALTYINALGGDTPTATVLGSQEKRNLLNKLLGVRNVKGNPEVPEGLFVKEGDHPWRSFRLDRFVKARALENTQAQFSQQAYEKAQSNFSPKPVRPVEQHPENQPIQGRLTNEQADRIKELQQHYEAKTPERIKVLKSDAIESLSSRLVNLGIPVSEARTMASDTFKNVHNKVKGAVQVISGMGKSDLSRLAGSGRPSVKTRASVNPNWLTSAFESFENDIDLAMMKAQQVGGAESGVRQVTPEQGQSFVTGERLADTKAFGSSLRDDAASPPRVYASVVEGQKFGSQGNYNVFFEWNQKTPIVATSHHHYGVANGLTDIHASANVGDKNARTFGDPSNETYTTLPSGKKVLDTHLLVGNKGIPTARTHQLIVSTPSSGLNEVKKAYKKGGLSAAKKELAKVVSSELVGKQSQGKAASYASPEGVPMTVAIQRNRTEAYVLNPDLSNVKKVTIVSNKPDEVRLLKENIRQAFKNNSSKLPPIQVVSANSGPSGNRGRKAITDEHFKLTGETRFSPTKLDADHANAVQSGDMETAQRLVDEAAKKAGYWLKAFHGTRANKQEFNNVFRNSRIGALGPGIYLSPSEEGPKAYSKLEGASGFVIPAFVRGDNLFKISHVNRSSEEYFKHFDPDGKLSDQDVQDKAKSEGFDGVFAASGGIDGAGEIAVFDPHQIKRADPATYDDNGNLIPLSERFNIQSDDIRFSPSRTLNNRGGAVYTSPTGHRAVQTSSRAGVRVYDSAGKRVGPVFQSVEKAEKYIAKQSVSRQGSRMSGNITYSVSDDWKEKGSAYFDKDGNIVVRLDKGIFDDGIAKQKALEKATELVLSIDEVPGEYWRGTNNKNELSILSSLVSKDHSSGNAEQGVSVSRGLGGSLFHGYKYYYKLKGRVNGIGADGEPVLTQATPTTKLMTPDKAWELNEKHTKYPPGWSRDKIKEWLNKKPVPQPR